MKNKFDNLLMRGGLDKDSYLELLPDIIEENRVNLKRDSAIAALVFIILAISAYMMDNFATVNTITYFFSGIACALFFVISNSKFTKKSPKVILSLVYLFMFILYAFSMVITVMHPDKPAVTTIVLLVAIPLLFSDRPIRMIVMTLFVTAVFCLLSYIFKTADLATVDIWNAVSFAVVATMAETLLMQVKIRNLYQAKKIEYLSKVDLLTSVKNRNSYEKYIQWMNTQENFNICCIYADVNGLHEMNNIKGHAEGDKMLQFVSSKMREQFGFDNTFRVGGDEFVSFTEGGKEIEEKTKKIIKECMDNKYFVSIGYAYYDGSIESMIQDAESKMYEAKKEFYSIKGNDRRKR